MVIVGLTSVSGVIETGLFVLIVIVFEVPSFGVRIEALTMEPQPVKVEAPTARARIEAIIAEIAFQLSFNQARNLRIRHFTYNVRGVAVGNTDIPYLGIRQPTLSNILTEFREILNKLAADVSRTARGIIACNKSNHL